MDAARRHYCETKNVSDTIQMIPRGRRNSVEMSLLKGLEKYGPSNLLAAINHVRALEWFCCYFFFKLYFMIIIQIPRGSRTMYVHGYQSYIWNKMASYRVKNHGLVPIIGDLVHKKSDHRNESELDNNSLVNTNMLKMILIF